MAERRMFARSIADSDLFTDMPVSTQVLYFHLVIRADDDGFINNPRKVSWMLGCGEDDLRLLAAKGYLIPFASGVAAIRHWKIHNYIRADRYKPTIYQDERRMLEVRHNGEYTFANGTGIPNVNRLVYQLDTRETQDRLGKGRLGEDREEGVLDAPEALPSAPDADVEFVWHAYERICVGLVGCRVLTQTRRRRIRAMLDGGFSREEFEKLFTKAQQSDFLKGDNPRGWRAGLDWLLRQGNAVKVLEGNFDNRKGNQVPKGASGQLGQAEMEAIRMMMEGN